MGEKAEKAKHGRSDGKQAGSAEVVRRGTAARGETHGSQADGDDLQRPVPQQPSELDESASSQEASNASMDEVGKIAFHDALASVDTDRGPVLDTLYNGPITEGHHVGDEEKVKGKRAPQKSTSSRDR